MVQFIGLSRVYQPIVGRCLNLGHIHLDTEPQTGPHSLANSASNWVTMTWIQSLKLGHIHLDTVSQSGAQ